jgi:hypothetical protein
MFIQVIEGKVRDQQALERQMQRWERDLMPGAIGYLGSTGGCTAAGDCCLIARFESRDAARRNSDRPEQSAWWRDTEACFDGPVTFHDSEEVEVMQHGDLDGARFVQVMEGHVADRDRAVALERESEPMLAEMRPDLLGSVTAYYDKDAFTEVAYFTSQDAARKGETQPMTDEVQAMFREWQDVMHVDRYLDIEQPWLMAKGQGAQ